MDEILGNRFRTYSQELTYDIHKIIEALDNFDENYVYTISYFGKDKICVDINVQHHDYQFTASIGDYLILHVECDEYGARRILSCSIKEKYDYIKMINNEPPADINIV